METFVADVIYYLVKNWLFGNLFSRSKLDYGKFFEKLGEKCDSFLTKTLNFMVLMLKNYSLNVNFCQNCEIHKDFLRKL